MRVGNLLRSSPATAMTAGIVSTCVVAVGAWVPALWYDEIATLSAARRSVSELGRLVNNVDAAHALHYLWMDLWLRLAPDDAFWLRLPSALALGFAAAGLAVLTRRLIQSSVAPVIAALLLVLLPTMARAGVEGRGYAFAIAAVIWATVAFESMVRAKVSDEQWYSSAAAYVLAMMAAIGFSSFCALLVPAHAVTVTLRSRTRSALRPLVLCGLIAAVVSTPLLLEVKSQSGQVAWIADQSLSPLTRVFEIFFAGAPAMVAFALAALAGALLAVRRGAAPMPTRLDSPMSLSSVCVPWLTVPPVLLALYSALVQPVFWARYLWFTVPALALLLTAAIVILAGTRRWLGVTALVAFMVLAVPAFAAQRTPLAKPRGHDYPAVSAVLAERSRPGDCIVFRTLQGMNEPSRFVAVAYPDGFGKPRDVLRDSSAPTARQLGGLWDMSLPTKEVTARTGTCPRVWVFTDAADSGAASTLMRDAGFRSQSEFERGPLRLIECNRTTEAGHGAPRQLSRGQ